MIEIDDAPALVDPIVSAAFEGWNDAADAASSVASGRQSWPDDGVVAGVVAGGIAGSSRADSPA